MGNSDSSMNAAAICLWVLIAIIIIVIIVWIACECSKGGSGGGSGKRPDGTVAVVKYGDGKRKEPLHTGVDGNSDKYEASSSLEMPFASPSGGTTADAYSNNFPTEELAKGSRFPANPPVMYSSQCSSSAGPDNSSLCAPAGNSKTGYNLNVENLMPASWRKGASSSKCAGESDDSAQWAAYAPSKAAFDSYITTAGSARLGVNTRTAKARNTGLPNLLRDAVAGGSSGPVPIGADAVLFNDSDFRQTLVYNSTGKFPDLTWC